MQVRKIKIDQYLSGVTTDNDCDVVIYAPPPQKK